MSAIEPRRGSKRVLGEDAEYARNRFSYWRVVPIALMMAGTLSFFAFDLHGYLSWEEFSRHRHALLEWRERHDVLAVLSFLGVYTLVVALSLPGAIWLTIIGGFLFGVAVGTICSVLAATLGACTVFLAARYLIADALRARAGPGIRRMEAGFRKHALSYLLTLRLVPLAPFWLVNLVPALLGVPFRTFLVGTAVGIIPGSIVYTLVGNGLGAVLDQGGTPNIDIIFEPAILAPILGLALLALSPVLYGHLKRRRSANDAREQV
jgi:uncharacterized membrane protein YdjX (TVP38/TMEM64 family)